MSHELAVLASELGVALAAGMLLAVSHKVLATSFIDTEGTMAVACTRQPIGSTELSRPVLTILTSISHRVRYLAVTLEVKSLVVAKGRAFGTVQTDMATTWADIHLILAPQTDESSRTNTVLEVVAVRVFVNQAPLTNVEQLQDTDILGSLATHSVVRALKSALSVLDLFVYKLTDRTNEAIGTLATKMPATVCESRLPDFVVVIPS